MQLAGRHERNLTAAVVAINAWNRAAIAFRATPQLATMKIAA
jgi:hypothetical protein